MKKVSALLFILFQTLNMFAQDKQRVALFDTQGTATESVRKELNDALMDALFNNPTVTVLSHSVLANAIKEKELQVSDSFDESQALEIGKSVGAKYICVSSVDSDDGFDFIINYRLIEIATGEIVARERKTMPKGDMKTYFGTIVKSKLLETKDVNNFVAERSQNVETAQSGEAKTVSTNVKEVPNFEPSLCGCEIAKADLPDGAPIPNGWRLPTLAELECMCANKDKIGGFNFGTYLSSDKEQGYFKGIKFQFCNETTVVGNYSRRLVRGRASTRRSGRAATTPVNAHETRVASTSNYKTTNRMGLELGFEGGAIAILTTGRYSSYIGQVLFDYRFRSRIALGIGLGLSQFAFIDFNIAKRKCTPFLRAEIGSTVAFITHFTYHSGYEETTDTSLEPYAGVIFGGRFGFNDHLALQIGLKGAFVVDTFAIGGQAGLLIHF